MQFCTANKPIALKGTVNSQDPEKTELNLKLGFARPLSISEPELERMRQFY